MFYIHSPQNPYDPPSLLHTCITQPVKTLIRLIHLAISRLRSAPKLGHRGIRLVCISDTHCLTIDPPNIPNGDILIHCGDLTNAGTPSEIQAQINWLASLPHQHKVVIAGNHDTWLDPRSRKFLNIRDRKGKLDWKGIWYLQHSAVSLKFHDGRRELKVFGAPQTACGVEHFAFQYPKGQDAWTETVPEDVDILVTHQPPKFHLDLPSALGDEYLLEEVRRVKPQIHVFGHVHAGRSDFFGWLNGGREIVKWDEAETSLERALNRKDGLVRGIIDPRSWMDMARVAIYGILGIIWEQVWVGTTPTTVMVNASLMYNNTGQLGNRPQVVVM
ncbi:hypothetical protein M433DRAFT_173387 [Acidomyces richmondensis BFW]|nr:MAG: hypothetical protein FE78DRAFT_30287 [Acidomyces sp. 'richmondensis']KYG46744.1 hypothetical protein M433DRAFT_173387 [Acidomyces richmondensis BFW]